MYWIAKKENGELISLTEQEALIQRKDNNISRRMSLQFIGVSDGSAFKKEMLKAMAIEKEAELLEGVEAKKKLKEAEDLRKNAMVKEAELAKENGMQEPDRGLDVIIKGVGVGEQQMAKARRSLPNMAR